MLPKLQSRAVYSAQNTLRESVCLAASLIAGAETTADLTASLFTTTHGHIRLRLSALDTC